MTSYQEPKMSHPRQFAIMDFLRVIAAIAIFLAALPVYAQVSTATINGMVHDASGAAIPDAEVVLRNIATGVETRTQSNASGVYVVLNILPGDYTLSARKA